MTQVAIEPIFRNSGPAPDGTTLFPQQPLNGDLAYMYAWQHEQASQKAYQQYLHDKAARGTSAGGLTGPDVAGAVGSGSALGVGGRPGTEVRTLSDWSHISVPCRRSIRACSRRATRRPTVFH